MSAVSTSGPLVQIHSEAPAHQRAPSSLIEVLAGLRDAELLRLFDGSRRVFDEIASRHLERWVVTFSGGKDSTLTALLAVDYLSRMATPPQLDIVYSDTLLEIPAMREAAGRFLKHLERMAERDDLPIKVRIVRPAVEDRFWARMIGRGYPPPKPKFRWCTRRLKIEPAEPYVATGVATAVLTGVRYGESSQRTGRLVASCTNGGECGQDYWAERGPQGSKVTYFAPIIEWKTCKVWDFLHFVAPPAGWPTQDVYALYGDTNLRFGCWTCTLVRRDKTIEALTGGDVSSPLGRLNQFRNELLRECALRKNRLARKTHLGPLKLSFRKELLDRLLALQKECATELISPEEVLEIRRLWALYLAHKRGPKTRPLAV